MGDAGLGGFESSWAARACSTPPGGLGVWVWPTKDLEPESEKERAAVEEIWAQGPVAFQVKRLQKGPPGSRMLQKGPGGGRVGHRGEDRRGCSGTWGGGHLV